MKILNELYYGNINPSERSFAYCKDAQKLAHKITEYEQTLLAGLTDEQKNLFRKFDNCVTQLYEIENRYCFTTGFRLGVRMTSESFLDE